MIVSNDLFLFQPASRDIWTLSTCILFEDTFANCILQHDAIVGTLWLLVTMITYSFIWSIIGRNSYKIDQIWCMTPWFCAWLTFYHHLSKFGSVHKRLLLMCILITFWSLRLIYNFWRRRGYGNISQHSGDNGWHMLRSKEYPLLFIFFSPTFIASSQNIILWLIAAAPVHVVYGSDPDSLSLWDRALTLSFLLCLAVDAIAEDQPLRDFEQIKHSLGPKTRMASQCPSVRDGFLQRGMRMHSRHLKCFAEQALWMCLYLFTLVGDHPNGNGTHTSTVFSVAAVLLGAINWTGLGCIMLMSFIQGSMESTATHKCPVDDIGHTQVPHYTPWFRAQSPSPRSSNS